MTLTNLPPDLQQNLFGYCSNQDLCRVSCTSKGFNIALERVWSDRAKDLPRYLLPAVISRGLNQLANDPHVVYDPSTQRVYTAKDYVLADSIYNYILNSTISCVDYIQRNIFIGHHDTLKLLYPYCTLEVKTHTSLELACQGDLKSFRIFQSTSQNLRNRLEVLIKNANELTPVITQFIFSDPYIQNTESYNLIPFSELQSVLENYAPLAPLEYCSSLILNLLRETQLEQCNQIADELYAFRKNSSISKEHKDFIIQFLLFRVESEHISLAPDKQKDLLKSLCTPPSIYTLNASTKLLNLQMQHGSWITHISDYEVRTIAMNTYRGVLDNTIHITDNEFHYFIASFTTFLCLDNTMTENSIYTELAITQIDIYDNEDCEGDLIRHFANNLAFLYFDGRISEKLFSYNTAYSLLDKSIDTPIPQLRSALNFYYQSQDALDYTDPLPLEMRTLSESQINNPNSSPRQKATAECMIFLSYLQKTTEQYLYIFSLCREKRLSTAWEAQVLYDITWDTFVNYIYIPGLPLEKLAQIYLEQKKELQTAYIVASCFVRNLTPITTRSQEKKHIVKVLELPQNFEYDPDLCHKATLLVCILRLQGRVDDTVCQIEKAITTLLSSEHDIFPMELQLIIRELFPEMKSPPLTVEDLKAGSAIRNTLYQEQLLRLDIDMEN